MDETIYKMNERIKKLAEQAGYTTDMFGIGHWDMPECKKFAELIVAECIDIAKKWEDQLENANSLDESNAVGIVAYRIARQFGVKE
jgi:hypothetical protein